MEFTDADTIFNGIGNTPGRNFPFSPDPYTSFREAGEKKRGGRRLVWRVYYYRQSIETGNWQGKRKVLQANTYHLARWKFLSEKTLEFDLNDTH
jgi:hypothetical protein